MKPLAVLGSVLIFSVGPAHAQLSSWGANVRTSPPAGQCTKVACRCFLELGNLTKRLSVIYYTPIDANGRYYGTPDRLQQAQLAAQNINVVRSTALHYCKEAGVADWVPYIDPSMNNMRFQ